MGKRKPVKRRPAVKRPSKPLTKAGNIAVAATLVFLVLAITISSLTSKSTPVAAPTSSNSSPTSTSPTYKTDVVTYTYAKGDVTPWPWKVSGMTVTCNSMDGDATAVVGGKTYGITGRDAIHSTIRGYAEIENIMIDPSDSKPSTETFDSRVTADCTAGMVGH